MGGTVDPLNATAVDVFLPRPAGVTRLSPGVPAFRTQVAATLYARLYLADTPGVEVWRLTMRAGELIELSDSICPFLTAVPLAWK